MEPRPDHKQWLTAVFRSDQGICTRCGRSSLMALEDSRQQGTSPTLREASASRSTTDESVSGTLLLSLLMLVGRRRQQLTRCVKCMEGRYLSPRCWI